jgi:hypothetical protein
MFDRVEDDGVREFVSNETACDLDAAVPIIGFGHKGSPNWCRAVR